MQPVTPLLSSVPTLPVIPSERPKPPEPTPDVAPTPSEAVSSPDQCQAQLPASYAEEPTAVCFPGVVRGTVPSAQAPYAVSTRSEDGAAVLAEQGAQLRAQIQNMAQTAPEQLEALLKQTYGERLQPEQLQTLLEQARSGQFPLPAHLRLVDSGVLNGNHAAYSPENGGTVYLNRNLPPEQQLLYLTQELGHHIDQQLGLGDSPGDEGAMLARGLANGRALTPDEQTQLRGTADQSVIQVDGREIEVEHAVPLIPVALWVGKAAAETGLDAFMEYALASLTGTDPPGFWDHAGNFAINLVGGGPAKKLRTIARITEAVDNMRDTFRVISQIPGGRQLVDEIGQLGGQLDSALRSGNLDQAKSVYDRLVNKLGDARALATERSNMLAEMSRNGVRYTEGNIVRMARGQDGRIVFLETGSATAGLNHVLTRHSADFARRGVPEDQIPDLLMAALTRGNVVGQQGTDPNRLRPIYEVVFNGQRQRVAITTGSNGFLVGANPA
ncbi:MAG: hypothetical protein ACO1RX_12735 [Candidatus Sericytochromatia bacterium]